LILVVLSAAGCGITACNRTPVPAAPPARMATNTTIYSDQPQPKLPSVKLWIGKSEIIAEVAATPRELATGMMHRKEMGENEGMLFIMPFPQRAAFYMKNTHLPLSVAYIDTEGTILEIHDLQPLNEEPVPSRSEKIHFVLEMKQGWFDRNQISIGAVIRTEHGSLRETFSRRR
jgi:uncharacterized membrane protein (UPF0127 family)